jgi:hypothetical protein
MMMMRVMRRRRRRRIGANPEQANFTAFVAICMCFDVTRHASRNVSIIAFIAFSAFSAITAFSAFSAFIHQSVVYGNTLTG